jgi:hypothetical protein
MADGGDDETSPARSERREDERKLIEARAEALYDASNTSSTPWARRGPAVRDAWLQIANREQKSSD